MFKTKAALFIVALSLNSLAFGDLNSGLVAHWNFENCDATDVTRRCHDGLISGASTSCVNGPASNKALLLNGLNNYIQAEDCDNSNDFNILNEVSYAIWVNPKSITKRTSLINKWYNSYEDKNIYIEQNKRVSFYLFNCMNAPLVSKTTIPVNEWTHIVATYDGVMAKIYINGELNNSLKAKPQCDVGDFQTSLYVGGHPERKGDFFPLKGAITDFRVYNRVLSSVEIKQVYFGQQQNTGIECTTVSKWNLDPKDFTQRQINLACPAGYTMVSGGAECYDYGGWMGRLTKSFPYGNGWAATCYNHALNSAQNNENAQIIKVMYVRCCK